MDKNSYYIDVDKKLIIETYKGLMTLENYKELKIREFADPDFDPTYHVIGDLRLTTINYTEEDLLKLIEFLIEKREYIGRRKSALVATKPIQVAASVIFDQSAGHLPLNVKIFNTIESAFQWVAI